MINGQTTGGGGPNQQQYNPGQKPLTAGGRQRWNQYYQEQVRPNIPAYMQAAYDARPNKARHLARSFWDKNSLARGTTRMDAMRQMNPTYSQASDELQGGVLGDLHTYEGGGTPIDFRRETVPYERQNQMVADLSRYTRERLGTGLTPQEEAVFRGRGIETAEATAAGAKRTMANAGSASGMDPRAMTSALGKIERTRQGQRSEVERDLIEKELKRKGEIEQLGTQVGGLEEQGRQFDIGTLEGARRFDVEADMTRRNQLEGRLGDLATMGEGRYEYDTGFIEARRQARQNRQLMRELSNRAQPGGLEKAGAILGGIRGALSMGG